MKPDPYNYYDRPNSIVIVARENYRKTKLRREIRQSTLIAVMIVTAVVYWFLK